MFDFNLRGNEDLTREHYFKGGIFVKRVFRDQFELEFIILSIDNSILSCDLSIHKSACNRGESDVFRDLLDTGVFVIFEVYGERGSGLGCGRVFHRTEVDTDYIQRL